jgi:hypothetical protein
MIKYPQVKMFLMFEYKKREEGKLINCDSLGLFTDKGHMKDFRNTKTSEIQAEFLKDVATVKDHYQIGLPLKC